MSILYGRIPTNINLFNQVRLRKRWEPREIRSKPHSKLFVEMKEITHKVIFSLVQASQREVRFPLGMKFDGNDWSVYKRAIHHRGARDSWTNIEWLVDSQRMSWTCCNEGLQVIGPVYDGLKEVLVYWTQVFVDRSKNYENEVTWSVNKWVKPLPIKIKWSNCRYSIRSTWFVFSVSLSLLSGQVTEFTCEKWT